MICKEADNPKNIYVHNVYILRSIGNISSHVPMKIVLCYCDIGNHATKFNDITSLYSIYVAKWPGVFGLFYVFIIIVY